MAFLRPASSPGLLLALVLFLLPIDSSTDLFPLKSSARLPRSVLQREYEGQIGTQTYDTNINIEQTFNSSMFPLRYIITLYERGKSAIL